MEENKRVVITYNLAIRGIWGRNRKVKHDNIRIMEVDKDKEQPTREQLEAAVKEWLGKLKPKSGLRWTLASQEETIQKYADSPFTSRTYQLFADTKLFDGDIA